MGYEGVDCNIVIYYLSPLYLATKAICPLCQQLGKYPAIQMPPLSSLQLKALRTKKVNDVTHAQQILNSPIGISPLASLRPAIFHHPSGMEN